MNNPCNPVEQQARADYIEALYQASGRTNGLYTGLFKERVDYLVISDQIKMYESVTDDTTSC
jgi:hypothetical protein